MACYIWNTPEDAFKFASLLVDNKAKLNIQNNITQSTALHLAVKMCNYSLAKFLVDHNADLTIKDNHGRTVLFHAVECGDLSMVKLLIDRGADLAPKDPNIQNPLTALGLAKSLIPINKDIIKLLEEKIQAQATETPEHEEEQNSEEPDKNETSVAEEKSLPESIEKVKPLNFYDKLCGEKSAAELIQYMEWKAYPKIRIKDMETFKQSDSIIKSADFAKELMRYPATRKALFNLGVYSSMLSKGVKKTALDNFLESLSDKSPTEAKELINDALQDETLIKNTGFGFYKFFHSGPKHIINKKMKDRWARSTTEELLIALYDSVETHEPENVKILGKTNR